MRAFAEEFNATVVPLGQNFRSLGAIVEAADQVISHNNPLRLRKDLMAMRGPGGDVQLMPAGSTRDNARAIARLIKDHAIALPEGSQQITHEVETGSWAVLARSNFAVNLMQAALDEAGVRNFRNSGSIYDTPVANVFLSLLTTLQTEDPVGLETAMLHTGIPPQVSGEILQAHRGKIGQLMDVGADLSRFGAMQSLLDSFFKRTSVWRRFARNGEYIDVIDRVAQFVVSAVRDHEVDMATAICDALSESLLRIRDKGLRDRVQAIQQRTTKRDPERAVALYTMHGSKGLEFKNVALLGMDDDSIPGDVERLGTGAGAVANVASERRLFYVGMTRAKDRLLIAYKAGKGSRFLAELPAAIRGA